MQHTTQSAPLYHVFADNFDDWVEDYSEALKMFNQLKKSGQCCRLYEESETIDEKGEPTGDFEEDCLKSFGSWPT